MRGLVLLGILFTIELAAAIAIPLGFGYFDQYFALPQWLKLLTGGLALIEIVVIFAGFGALLKFATIWQFPAVLAGVIAVEIAAQLSGVVVMRILPNYVTFAIGGGITLIGVFIAIICAAAIVFCTKLLAKVQY